MADHKVIDGLYYTKEHEWVKVEGGVATVGITDHAQDLLTDIVFVELPDTGKEVGQGQPACVVESVKSVSDVYAPVGGTISEANMELEAAPEKVNEDAYGEGWMFKLSGINEAELESLMSAEEYNAFVASEAH